MHHQKAGMMVISPLLKSIKAILQYHPHNAFIWPSNLLKNGAKQLENQVYISLFIGFRPTTSHLLACLIYNLSVAHWITQVNQLLSR